MNNESGSCDRQAARAFQSVVQGMAPPQRNSPTVPPQALGTQVIDQVDVLRQDHSSPVIVFGLATVS